MWELRPVSLGDLLNMSFGFEMTLIYWGVLAFGFFVLFVALLFDGLFGFGDDGSMVPAVGVFMGLFGSVGVVGRTLLGLEDVASILLALLISTGGAVFFYFGIWRMLKKQESTLEDRREDLVGKVVEVSLTITAKGLGQVTYTTQSGRNSSPARSIGGETIRQGDLAEVVQSAGTIYLVRPHDPTAKGNQEQSIQEEKESRKT